MKSANARRFLPKGPPLLGEEKKEPHMESIFMESETKREKKKKKKKKREIFAWQVASARK
jgi:hypothetical protein